MARHGAAVLAACAVALAFGAPARAATGSGAYIPRFSMPWPPHPAAIDRLSSATGRPPLLTSVYRQWRQPLVVRDLLEPIWGRGSIPLITWEPFNYHGGKFPLRKIARGRYDRYLRRSAHAAARWGHPILLRFAHEMNGDWYPWGAGVGGNTARHYKRAWRHVVRVFRAAGAQEVRWVWAPQINKGGRSPFRRFYPGDRWVDWIGLDGYNAGRDSPWKSFTEVFGSSYDQIGRMTSLPIVVTETGSGDRGGNKAAWVRSALTREIPRFRRIRGVVWFNDRFHRIDFRIASSAAALRAFRSGVSSRRYALSRADFLRTGRGSGRPSPAPPPPQGGFGLRAR